MVSFTFMRLLTRETDAAIAILTTLALMKDTVATSCIARELGLSRMFVRKATTKLASGGFISTKKGRNGGVALARKPDGIRVSDVLTALEGDIDLTPCSHGKGRCLKIGQCSMRMELLGIEATVRKKLESITIGSLVRRQASQSRGGQSKAQTGKEGR